MRRIDLLILAIDYLAICLLAIAFAGGVSAHSRIATPTQIVLLALGAVLLMTGRILFNWDYRNRK